MWRWRDLLDDRLDVAATYARRTLVVRMLIAAVTLGLIGYNLGLPPAGLWFGAYTASELWLMACWRRVDRHGSLSVPDRVNFLFANFFGSATWCGLAILLWTYPDEALHLAAFSILVAVMLHAQCFDFRAPIALAVVAGPPAILVLALPLALGGFSGPHLWIMIVGLSLSVVYVAVSAAANLRTAVALERAQAEAVAASRAKSAFLAMMSHELRTPMNGVLGLAGALKQTQLDEVQAGHVELLIRSGDGLMGILNDFLDISKIEAGKLEVEEAAFDLHDLIGRVGELWAQSAQAKGLELSCEIDPLTPQWVAGDANRIRQIAQNLVSNALKFTDRGGVRLSVAPAVGGVQLTVADTGIGISGPQQARLFESFAQADASIGRRFGGTGLGLAICKQLVGLMRGHISVDSAPDQGSTFRVFLPLYPVADPELGLAAEPDSGDLNGRRILVAEDNPTNQVVARTILEAAGAAIVIAEDGQEALERLVSEAFDLVLMDVHMPRMDGIEALRRIRAGEAGDPTIPVVALTADVLAEDQRRLAAAGFDAVQGKPVAPMALILALSDALASAPPRKRARL